MATQSNTGFHQYHHHHNHHHHQAQAMSFQSGTAASEIITVSSAPFPAHQYGTYYNHLGIINSHSNNNIIVNASNISSLMTPAPPSPAAGSMLYSGGGGTIISCSNSTTTSINNNNSHNNSGISQPGSSVGSLLLHTVPGLKHEAGLAVEWSVEEQYKLEEGLAKLADEPTIMKYIKIAAVLRDKTVRDVALRCRWMTDRMGSCLKTNMSSASPTATYPMPLQPHDQSESTSPISALFGTTRHLLEENNQALGQISANLTALKLQDNVGLFLQARSNLSSILNDMSNMPGIMSQMPPLPVFLNEELASSIIPSLTQYMMCGSSSGIHLKQEPGC